MTHTERQVLSSVGGPQASPPPILFESATLGPTGQLFGLAATIIGVRFVLATAVVTSEIGAHVFGSGTVALAVVALTNLTDFPDSLDLSTPDVLGSVLASPPPTSAEVSAPLAIALPAGTYALILASSPVLGATGLFTAPLNNPNVGTPSYFHRTLTVWLNGGFNNVRLFLRGT